MSGRLQETHYKSVQAAYESDQQQLLQYSDDEPTTIAVVRKPRDTGIEEICDEWCPELGMPERHLKRFWSYRSGFKTNSAVDNPIERAYEEARLDHYYEQYLRRSDEAQQALSDIVRRLDNGEDITLVCFEEPQEPCHRYKLIEVLTARLDSEYDFDKQAVTV